MDISCIIQSYEKVIRIASMDRDTLFRRFHQTTWINFRWWCTHFSLFLLWQTYIITQYIHIHIIYTQILSEQSRTSIRIIRICRLRSHFKCWDVSRTVIFQFDGSRSIGEMEGSQWYGWNVHYIGSLAMQFAKNGLFMLPPTVLCIKCPIYRYIMTLFIPSNNGIREVTLITTQNPIHGTKL
jgi:hypothetical protein